MEYECKECGKKFGTEVGLQQHRSAKHGKVEVKQQTKARKIPVKYFVYLAIVLVFVGGGYLIIKSVGTSTSLGSVGSTHEHVDFKVYINGQQIDFSRPRYQLRSQYVHVEGGVGEVVHKHATGVTMAYFLNTVGIKLTNNCISVDDVDYCSQGDKTPKVYVNGKPISDYESYELRDLDKVLVSYGSETPEQIEQQLSTITDLAKRESGM